MVKALKGEEKAMNKVIDFYRPYMRKISTRNVFNEFGEPELICDADILQELEMKAFRGIKRFKSNY